MNACAGWRDERRRDAQKVFAGVHRRCQKRSALGQDDGRRLGKAERSREDASLNAAIPYRDAQAGNAQDRRSDIGVSQRQRVGVNLPVNQQSQQNNFGLEMNNIINKFDVSVITDEVNLWKRHKRYAYCDTSTCESGIAYLSLEKMWPINGTIVTFEIHKISRSGLFARKAGWIIQIYSVGKKREEVTKHGCVSAHSLYRAITLAKNDVKCGFSSVEDFELCLEGFE